MSADAQEVIICECGLAEHQFVLSMYDWEDEIEVYLEPHLSTYRNIFKRIWVALRYVFGHRSRYGEWDCVLLGKEQLQQMGLFIDEALDYIYKLDEKE